MNRKPEHTSHRDWAAADIPELSDEDYARMRPVSEKHSDIPRRVRGPQKKPRKVLLSMRYSPEVIDYFKSTGKGWQARIDEVLREYVDSHE